MRQLTFTGPGQVVWEDAPAPVLALPDQVLVRPLAVARCDLDPVMAAFGMFPGPFAVGHEMVAQVAAVGGDVGRHAVGDRVVVPFQVSCGTCAACTTGRTPACLAHRARAGAAFGFGTAGGGHGGGIADLLLVPHADHLLLAAPEGVADEILCTLPDNVIDAHRSVAPGLARFPGADVVIVGGLAASIGLYAIHIAIALGAGRVTLVDDDADRSAIAEGLGATVISHGGDYDVDIPRAPIVVENSGTREGFDAAVGATEWLGLLTSIAIHFEPRPLPLLKLYTRGITFHTSRADSRGLLGEVMDLVATGTIDPSRVPTVVRPWDEAAEAWLEPATKLVVTRSDGA